MHSPIFAFDFSMNKPAMAALINDRLTFYVWPSDIDDVVHGALCDCGVEVFNRNLPPVKNLNEHSLIYEHVTRATNLANMILAKITELLDAAGITDKDDVIISNEGFAFSAKGDAALDLSGYKYILMKTLMDNGFKRFNTYAPTTLKATAGCAKKGMSGKDKMIMAISTEPANGTIFCDVIREHPELLKKRTAFMLCVDDLADAYWCMKTTVLKEKIKCIINGE